MVNKSQTENFGFKIVLCVILKLGWLLRDTSLGQPTTIRPMVRNPLVRISFLFLRLVLIFVSLYYMVAFQYFSSLLFLFINMTLRLFNYNCIYQSMHYNLGILAFIMHNDKYRPNSNLPFIRGSTLAMERRSNKNYNNRPPSSSRSGTWSIFTTLLLILFWFYKQN